MPRRLTAALPIVLVLAACAARAGPSGAPGPSLATGLASTPGMSPSSIGPTPSAAASAPELVPTLVPFPSGQPADGVPAALEQLAWVAAQTEDRPDGSTAHQVFGGLLNHPPAVRLDVADPAGYPWLVTAAGDIAIATSSGTGVHVEIRDASDAAIVGAFDVVGAETGELAIDPERKLAYLGTRLAGGGVAIHRLAFDGSGDDILIRPLIGRRK